ncbi:MAG: RimK/LysX family protein [Proteobacteria bacterium]|nr:RimK/LysX family protein [Pseudomonadota bacterium]
MLILIVIFLHLLFTITMANDKIIIGTVEDVILLPWGVKLPARIDTGAATSSLDARNLIIKDDSMAEFYLPEKYGGGLKLCLPIVDWRTVKSTGEVKKRPVVEMEICIGSKRFRAQVNLNNRSKMTYPMLIGRNILKESFLVDTTRSGRVPPTCPEASQK